MKRTQFDPADYVPQERFGHPDDGDCFEVWEPRGSGGTRSSVVEVKPGGVMHTTDRFTGESAWMDAARKASDRSLAVRQTDEYKAMKRRRGY